MWEKTALLALSWGPAVAIGLCTALQVGVNSELRGQLHSPLQAAFISFLVGTLVLTMLLLVQGDGLPKWQRLADLPLWMWAGGLLGAFNVGVTIFLAQRMSALALAAGVISAQLITSMLLDHFGWLGFQQRSINWQAIAGVILLIAGVTLIAQR